MIKIKTKKSGYITTISAVIVGAITIMIVISLLAQGIDFTKNSSSNIYAAQARAIAQACAEEAIQKVRDNTNYAGNFSLFFENGTCSSTVSNLGSPNFIIISQGTSTNATEKLKIIINQVNPKINVLSWQKVADF